MSFFWTRDLVCLYDGKKRNIKMNVKLFDLNMGQLPTQLPLLSLPGLFLMPTARVSLKLVDIKQITMIFKALAAGRMVGIIQDADKGQKPYRKGCAGRISGFIENEDDSLTLYLTGVSRFEVVNRFCQDDIDMISVQYNVFQDDFKNDMSLDISELLFTLDVYATVRKLDIKSSLFTKMNAQKVIAALVSILPFSSLEKQALLEKTKWEQCRDALLTLLKMETIQDKEKGQC